MVEVDADGIASEPILVADGEVSGAVQAVSLDDGVGVVFTATGDLGAETVMYAMVRQGRVSPDSVPHLDIAANAASEISTLGLGEFFVVAVVDATTNEVHLGRFGAEGHALCEGGD